MNQKACVTDSREDLCWRGWGRKAGQQVPGAATEMDPLVQKETGVAATEASGWQRAASGGQRCVGVSVCLWVVGSLWSVVSMSFGEDLELL